MMVVAKYPSSSEPCVLSNFRINFMTITTTTFQNVIVVASILVMLMTTTCIGSESNNILVMSFSYPTVHLHPMYYRQQKQTRILRRHLIKKRNDRHDKYDTTLYLHQKQNLIQSSGIFIDRYSSALFSHFQQQYGSSASDQSSFTQQQQQHQQVNPTIDSINSLSLNGVRYSDVRDCIDYIYPTNDLHKRNAISRSDGYWRYIQNGIEPPQDLTYGEFDIDFFAQLLDISNKHYYDSCEDQNFDEHRWNAPQQDYHTKIKTSTSKNNWNDKVFYDIGSGTGRLVLTASALHSNFRACRGIELLQGIHEQAIDNLNKCKLIQNNRHTYALTNLCHGDNTMPRTSSGAGEESNNKRPDKKVIQLPMAPIDFVCGSIDDPNVSICDADIIFAFSSCFSPLLLQTIATVIINQCSIGTIVITTDYMLPLTSSSSAVDKSNHFDSDTSRNSNTNHLSTQPSLSGIPIEVPILELELVETIHGWCWLTGGSSTAYIHRVVATK